MNEEERIVSIEKSIRYISNRVKSNGREILESYSLSPLQFIALQYANDTEGITIGELSKKLYLAHSTTTDIVNKLEEGQFVKRKKFEKDKRIVLVLIEPRGQEVIEEVIKKRIKYISNITRHLSDSDKEKLPFLLESILKESEQH